MSGVVGILVVAALAWSIYAGRVKVIARRSYNWSRSEIPDLDSFVRLAESSVVEQPDDLSKKSSGDHHV